MSGGLKPTRDAVDPVAGAVASGLVPIGGALALLISIVLTIVHRADIVAPAAAVVAVVLVALAGGVAAVGVLPRRMPFTEDRLWLVIVLSVGGAVGEYVSTLGHDRVLYDDFGPLTIGILLLAVSPFCTAVSLVAAGLLASAVLAILVAGAATASGWTSPLAALILVDCAPILALAAAAAVYSRVIVRSTLAWQRQLNRTALRAGATPDAEFSEARLARIALFRDEVMPLLAHVVTAPRLTVAETDRARRLADALRRAARERTESTWLDDLARDLRRRVGVDVVVDDARGHAAALDVDRRAALGALVSWLGDGHRAERLRVTVRHDVAGVAIAIRAAGGATPGQQDDGLERFVESFRSVGFAAAVRHDPASGLGGGVGDSGENVTVELRDEVTG